MVTNSVLSLNLSIEMTTVVSMTFTDKRKLWYFRVELGAEENRGTCAGFRVSARRNGRGEERGHERQGSLRAISDQPWIVNPSNTPQLAFPNKSLGHL